MYKSWCSYRMNYILLRVWSGFCLTAASLPADLLVQSECRLLLCPSSHLGSGLNPLCLLSVVCLLIAAPTDAFVLFVRMWRRFFYLNRRQWRSLFLPAGVCPGLLSSSQRRLFIKRFTPRLWSEARESPEGRVLSEKMLQIADVRDQIWIKLCS